MDVKRARIYELGRRHYAGRRGLSDTAGRANVVASQQSVVAGRLGRKELVGRFDSSGNERIVLAT